MGAASMFFGMATRMAKDLNLFQENDLEFLELSDLPIRLQKEVKRRVWWICFIADRYNSAGTQKPFCIHENDIYVEFSTPELIWDESRENLSRPHEPKFGTSIKLKTCMDVTDLNGFANQSCFNVGILLVNFSKFYKNSSLLNKIDPNLF